ncbi:MAG: hypothetical protein WCO09_00225 [bacterium]
MRGAIQVYCAQGYLLSVKNVDYTHFISLVGSYTAVPLSEDKDRAFIRRQSSDSKKKNSFIPFSMLVSSNGCTPAALREMRKNFSKKPSTPKTKAVTIKNNVAKTTASKTKK